MDRWSEYITQCPIQPGSKFSQKIILSFEEGTLWWHAHSDWTRATVHGAIIIYPKNGTKYPFPKPNAEVPIILGQWWKSDVNVVRDEALATGADPNASDSLLINGQPGDLFHAQNQLNAKKEEYTYKDDTFKLTVDHGKTYLLRIINAALHEALFFSIAKHKMTVVGTDGSYTKPLTRDYITIYPGQTYDVLLEANQHLDHYYMAAKTYSIAPAARNFFDNTTTTAIIQVSNAQKTEQKVRVLEYNSTVEIVFQGTNLIVGTTPPHASPWITVSMLLDGDLGISIKDKDPLPLQSGGSSPSEYHLRSYERFGLQSDSRHPTLNAIRLGAMDTAFIVKNGKHPESSSAASAI
ncbi:putative laccase-9 [Vitis vinifera]|uniref:laccase n=1 Tax=Vitis vinifera TaxID=29760 RepID=A0A438CUG0_VITVI|nr:putative laccase-9 [Vitis vinifera]